MARNPFSQKREDFIEKQTNKLNKEIEKSQNRFLKMILDGFLTGVAIDALGNVVADESSIFLPSRLDKLYDQFLTDEIKPIIDSFTKNVKKLLRFNKGYFDSIDGIDEKADHDSIKDFVLTSVGISTSVVAGGSLLYSILTSRDVIQTIKGIVMGGVQTGMNLPALRHTVEEVIAKKEGGIVKSFFNEMLPEPYVKVDRFIGQKYSIDLGINYFIYQGGLIGTSRPFCIERNNKVFSREEILLFGTPQDEFGGYDDKGTGHFQGKPEPYDPMIDCGGFNCRHIFDAVSDQLAFHLRPELRSEAAGLLN